MSTGATQWRISDDPALLAQLAESVRRTDPQPVDRREVDRVAHSVVRWLARRDGATVAGVGAGAPGASVTRRRIFARLDRLLHTASPGNLPALAARVGRIRAALQQRSNAGVELHLTALLGRDCVSVEWLDEIEQRLAGIARRWTDSRSGAQLSCVLMIRRRPRT